ncbi:MAG: glycosyltransferase [Polyangiaceae bacterium]
MKIALLTHGTRGDVQPFLALAHALEARGHEVVLGAPANLVGFVDRCGVRSAPLAIDSQAFLESEEGRKWLASGHVREFTERMLALFHQHAEALDRDVLAACEGADAIIAGALMEDRAACVAEARGLPLALVHMFPVRVTGDYASGVVTGRTLPFRFLNRATYALFDHLFWRASRDDINALRSRLGLPATTLSTAARSASARTLIVNAYSRHIVPPPSDWPEEQIVTGAFAFPESLRARLDEGRPPADLAAFLDAGPAPVFLGFGSMPVTDPEAMMRVVAAVTERLGVRAVVGAGWSKLVHLGSSLPERVSIVDTVNHEWLLPRCAAAVHHGGSGTTAAVLRAGLPALVTSVFADQPFWGARVERLGVGVHVPYRRLTEATLAAGLARVLTPEARARASALGAAIRSEEDGVPVAVRAIESRFASAPAGE